LLTVDCDVLRAVLVLVIVTPGRIAPLESRIVPVRTAVDVCPKSTLAENRTRVRVATNTNHRPIFVDIPVGIRFPPLMCGPAEVWCRCVNEE
jgi:hypothetical protein